LDIAEGFEALHIAAKEGVLIRGVSVSEKTKYGERALHLAASNCHLRDLKLLALKSLIHVLNVKGHNGWTIAHRAVTSANDNLVLWLIRHPNIDLGLRDKHSCWVIEFVATYSNETMLKEFLDRRPDDVAHSDSFGNTPFHMAVAGTNQQNFSFLYDLCKRGCVAHPGTNKWGKTVVDLAQPQERPVLDFG
jgi:ankyrin repeat protein